MREVARELVVEPLAEAGEEASAAGEDDVAHDHLAQVRVARGQRLRDERGDGARQVRVRSLHERRGDRSE